jgi:hypothetical protein
MAEWRAGTDAAGTQAAGGVEAAGAEAAGTEAIDDATFANTAVNANPAAAALIRQGSGGKADTKVGRCSLTPA